MAAIRKPFQGVINIIRFNRHFYILSIILVILLSVSGFLLDSKYHLYITGMCLLVIIPVLISLLVSFYVYDVSGLYTLKWLDGLAIAPGSRLINIHAGFDETSSLLSTKFSDSCLAVYDFYDPEKHTELSIRRARKAYPPYRNTITTSTSCLPIPTHTADVVFVLFSAHEIRDTNERIVFFKELNRVVTHSGKVVVAEHIRDFSNFLAYNIGFLHFLSRTSWLNTFRKAGFVIAGQVQITPFITSFTLERNGTAS